MVFKYDEYDPEGSDHYNPCVIKYPYARDIYFMFLRPKSGPLQ